MKDLTAFQRDLLRIIEGIEEPIGLDTKDAIEDYYEDAINHGRLYPNLDELVQKGFVEKEQLDGRTNVYKLTRDGRSAIAERDRWNQRQASTETPKNLKQEA